MCPAFVNTKPNTDFYVLKEALLLALYLSQAQI